MSVQEDKLSKTLKRQLEEVVEVRMFSVSIVTMHGLKPKRHQSYFRLPLQMIEGSRKDVCDQVRSSPSKIVIHDTS